MDRRNARLADCARDALRADPRRIVIVGARGWIGRTLLSLLREALGDDAFARRVSCFGSSDGMVDLDGDFTVPQRALSQLASIGHQPTLLFHLAFLTKDKVAGMAPAAYDAANRALSDTVLQALDLIGADRIFVASSGAAAFAKDPAAADDLRRYGQLKLADENLFAKWAETGPFARKAAIGRIYSVSGPWMNKHETYALASFILSALKGEPIEVRAPMEVHRSYVAVRELLSVVIAALLDDSGERVLSFSTGGTPLELADVAASVAKVCGGDVSRAPIAVQSPNYYCGEEQGWNALLERYGITHTALVDQIGETAAYLARTTAGAGSPQGKP